MMYFYRPGRQTDFQMDAKPRDLEERTTQFAERIRHFVRQLPRTISNLEDTKQLIRASGSVPANCIEANEALGDKDRLMRFRISRKEAKECQLWLRLLNTGESATLDTERSALRQEAHELKLIFNAIIRKLE
jgi:four helix bundle protein